LANTTIGGAAGMKRFDDGITFESIIYIGFYRA
jgi:hypothetical protein